MIFVTIGTTIPFDELFEEIDRLIGEGIIKDEIICQTGQSIYEPKNCEFFKFKPNVDDYIEKADQLIIHGGTGSTFGALLSQKPFIAFANPRGADDHQAEFLTELSAHFKLPWSRNCSDLSDLLMQIEKEDFTKSVSTPQLPLTIKDLIFM